MNTNYFSKIYIAHTHFSGILYYMNAAYIFSYSKLLSSQGNNYKYACINLDNLFKAQVLSQYCVWKFIVTVTETICNCLSLCMRF